MAGQLTRIVAGKVHPDRVNLYLDGEYWDSIDAELVYRYQLHPGDSLSDDVLQELKLADSLIQAKTAALRYLRARNRSKLELVRFLERKGYEETITGEVLDHLAKLQLIDDASYAQVFINDRLRSNPRSRRMLRYELSQKGISQSDIEYALSTADTTEQEAALSLVRKRAKSYREDNAKNWKLKTYKWLQSKGFSSSTAMQAIEQVIRHEISTVE
ncbi:MAG: recX [Bacilli bacterium]|nr:recX [Bacilli bacterium]